MEKIIACRDCMRKKGVTHPPFRIPSFSVCSECQANENLGWYSNETGQWDIFVPKANPKIHG